MSADDPERVLLEELLDDAAEALAGPDGPNRRSAREWVLATDPDWAFSFVNVCAALGLDPDTVRARLCGPMAGAPHWRP